MTLVCSNCGSDSIAEGSLQPSVDGRWPLGLCRPCNRNALPPAKDAPDDVKQAYANAVAKRAVRTHLTPLVPAELYAGKRSARRVQAAPEDLFAGFADSAFAVRR